MSKEWVIMDERYRVKNGFLVFKDSGKYLHRYVYESAFGQLGEGFVVVHVNGKKRDNRHSNLVAVPKYLYDWLVSAKMLGKVNADKLKHLASTSKAKAKKGVKRLAQRSEIEAYKKRLEGIMAAEKRGYRPLVKRNLRQSQSVEDWVKENPGKVKRYSEKGKKIESTTRKGK